ncbi:hypothetical protein JM47_03705 [Ureaplasma diversum]|uniref:Uncharacterized protein n=1 Tax=Ureaplasma diversum TaxID=42094 RepID=A0A0C5RLQ0_9BACT|nr:hypothetical protein JM47_03705 [Ureaplasma diversum]
MLSENFLISSSTDFVALLICSNNNLYLSLIFAFCSSSLYLTFKPKTAKSLAMYFLWAWLLSLSINLSLFSWSKIFKATKTVLGF